MFTKLRNRFPDTGVIIVIGIFILALPFMLVLAVLAGIFPSKRDAKFKADYALFLSQHEGEEFFCYTNRKNSVNDIENYILPELGDAIKVIKLEGKEPQTDLDHRFISHALYNLKYVGFPNIMKIVNAEMHDYSIHNQVYSAISQSCSEKLPEILRIGRLAMNSNITTKDK
jgi:hypothetical protein